MKRQVSSLIAIILLISPVYLKAQHVPGKKTFTSEIQLEDRVYREAIDKFYNSGLEGAFKGEKGIRIYYKAFLQDRNEKGAIVVSTGRTEGAVKYKELLFDLFLQGYSVYIHDHRGQGLSGRMAPDPQMGHVDDFDHYVEDLKTFYDEVVSTGDHEKYYLLAHSMGGTIGMRYLEQYPDDFQAAVFSSPMLGLSPVVCMLGHILSGKKVKYAPGQTAYHDDSTAFAGNEVTGSEARYFMKIGEYAAVPEAKVGGPSIQWLDQSCKSMKDIRKDIELINTPVLIFSAGDETVVNPGAHEKFNKKAQDKGKICLLIQVPGARHELFMETDEIRNSVLNSSLEFFEKYQ